MGQSADKIKITAPLGCIIWECRSQIVRSEELGLPYKLYIHRDPIRQTYTMEFSAKILLDDYPQLINPNTIRMCFERINALGVCEIDVDRILNEAVVRSMDFTRDVSLSDIPNARTMRDLKSIIHLSINNYRKWTCQDYQNNGMVVSNNVKDKRYERRLTFYDKQHELSLSTNRPFLRALEDSESLLSYFRGKVRIELRATTMRQIMKWLDITDLTLRNVIESQANPLETVMTEMFAPIYTLPDASVSRHLSLDRLSTLKLNQWDLRRIEAHVRVHRPHQWHRDMQRYRELYMMHHNLSQPMSIIDIVRS